MQENFSKIRVGYLSGLLLFFLFGLLSGYTLSTYSSHQVPSDSYQSMNANGIDAQLVRFQPEGAKYRLEICYDLPDRRDWLLTNPDDPETTFVQFDEYQISPIEEGTIRWLYSSEDEIVGRCQYLIFARPDPVFREAKLVVSSLFAYETDYSDCESLRHKMAEKYRFIGFECMGVAGIEGVAMVRVPIEYFGDRTLRNDFSNLMTKQQNGPWSFTFFIAPP